MMIRALALLPLLTLGCVDGTDDGADGGLGNGTDAPEGLGDDLTALVSYQVTAEGELTDRTLHDVPDDLAEAQDDTEVHEAIWAQARVIFESHLDWMGLFVVFTDGADGTLAQVFTLRDDPTTWALAVDQEDALDEEGNVGSDALTYTLVHEMAHIVGLNADQIALDPDLAADPENTDLFEAGRAACDTLFLDEGCALPDAYIYRFHQDFWTDLADYEAELAATEDEAEQEEIIAAQYEAAPERFVSEYAATDVAEDFAESFAIFALEDSPAGALERDEKVRFFEQFDDLVGLRADLQAAGIEVNMRGLTARPVGCR